jgi:tetratricopeptide (TPR) repeat protein
LALGLTACSGQRKYTATVRVFDGREVNGRPVPSAAYAAYLKGARLEQLGQISDALSAYRTALSYDDDSVEIQTRIASLVCRTAPADADPEFADAISRDTGYADAWQAWSRCALSRKRPREALHLAREALRIAPSDFASTEVLVDALLARGDVAEAQRVLLGFVATFEQEPQAWSRVRQFAEAQGQAAWASEAKRRYQALRAANGCASCNADEQSGRSRLVERLRNGDLIAARSISVELRLPPTQLAILAAELGQWELALKQAEWVLAIDPSDSDARLVALVAAYRLARTGEPSRLGESAERSRVSARAAALLARLLQERAGDPAAAALLAALKP